MQIRRSMQGIRSGGSRASLRWARLSYPPVLVSLLLLAFLAGLAVRSAGGTVSPAATLPAPVAPTLWESTPTPAATPTPVSTELGDPFDTLYVDIESPDYARLAAKRDEALALGILLSRSEDYVAGTVHLNHGAPFPVQLRLKGDWTDHLVGDKWSFRIRTRGESYVYGMKVFAIQDPSTRAYLNEWLFHQNIRREGGLSVGYRFVRVVVNGTYKGIYAVEEGFAKEMVESQQRRMGLLLRYDEDLMWQDRALYRNQLAPWPVEHYYLVDDFELGDDAAAEPAIAAQSDIATGMLRAIWTGERPAGEVLDLETTGRFLALSDLWSARHGLFWHNLRYYYNPISTRLEPVSFDSDPLVDHLETAGLPRSIFINDSDLFLGRTVFYDDPLVQAAYVKELARVSEPGYVAALEAALGPEYEAMRAAMVPEFGEAVLERPWELLRKRQALIREALNPLQTTYAYAVRPQPVLTAALAVDLANLLDWPVEVVGMETAAGTIPARPDWVVSESAALTVAPEQTAGALVLRGRPWEARELPYVQLRIPRAELPGGGWDDPTALPEITLVTRLWGLTATHTQTLLAAYPEPYPTGPQPAVPLLEEALAQHPYLHPAAEGPWLEIAPGTWEIEGDLILPAGYGLHLEPGTVLRFGPDNYLLAHGPLDFRGTEEAPIVLQPRESSWFGVIVLEAGAPSVWNYTTAESARAMARNGWTLTGGINFYRSPIRLDHARIVDAQGEDGINVIRTHFEFIDSEFGPTYSDAFDSDFSEGVVEGCLFHDTGADAIDVSGSPVEVRDTRAVNLGDKGISVGEQSRVTVENFTVEGADFGVACKDGSQATLTGLTVTGARIAGLAAYMKKPVFGPATIIATGITFQEIPEDRRVLVQTGCRIDLDGTSVWGWDFDVDELYEKWKR